MSAHSTLTATAALLCLIAAPASQAAGLPFTAQDIETANYDPAAEAANAASEAIATATVDGTSDSETLQSTAQTEATGSEAAAAPEEPDEPEALVVKLQILLDRAGISPGIIDGYAGGMSETALRAFESRAGLPVDGQLDADVWAALGGPQATALTASYTITPDDAAGLSAAPLPDDYAELARLDWIGFTSVTEKLAERFHMDEDFLTALNPGAAFRPGKTITVVNVDTMPPQGMVARIVVDKANSRLRALTADGRVITDYPVTVGSDGTPSPSGTMAVNAVALDPTYSYNPDLNFKQGNNDEFLTLPPGPNGPVGSVWIDLDKPTYGLHGTPYPAGLFNNQSHGCVRMTNWDANELAKMVSDGLAADQGQIMVEFAE